MDNTITSSLSTVDLVNMAYQAFDSADLYYGHGTDNAWDDACALVLDALDIAHDANDEQLAQLLSIEQITLVRSLIERRVQEKIPTPYLTQRAWFCGLPFYIDERALIPRSPLAEFIANHAAPWFDHHGQIHRILDLCTGSACIAIACAHYFDQAQIDAVDIDSGALAVAQRNINNYQLSQQINLYQGDLFSALTPEPPKLYDLIISNPPYVGAEEMTQLPEEYQHEPELALRAGELGLDIVDTMLRQAVNFLTEQGILVVEVGNTWQIMEQYYTDLAFNWLSFEHGGSGVFVLTKTDLKRWLAG